MPARRTLSLPQGRISYLEQGHVQAGEPSFVLIHGLMGTASTFLPLFKALSPERHAIALDLPGAGCSNRNRRMSSHLGAMARCVHQALDALDLPAPLLVGHSHGGAVALHLAASEPGRVGALGLLAPAHPYFRHADPLISFYLSPAGRLFAHTLPWYPQWMQLKGLQRMAGPGNRDTTERLAPYRENLRTRGTVPFLLQMLRTWHSDMRELRQLLETPLQLPTLLLWGDHDRAVPAGTAGDLMEHLRCVELHVLPGVGHRPAEERPELCAQLLEDWSRERRTICTTTLSAAG